MLSDEFLQKNKTSCILDGDVTANICAKMLRRLPRIKCSPERMFSYLFVVQASVLIPSKWRLVECTSGVRLDRENFPFFSIALKITENPFYIGCCHRPQRKADNLHPSNVEACNSWPFVYNPSSMVFRNRGTVCLIS
jgi:hypothetical protein